MEDIVIILSSLLKLKSNNSSTFIDLIILPPISLALLTFTERSATTPVSMFCRLHYCYKKKLRKP